MARKKDTWNIAFHFYECPICHEKGSIAFRTDADEDQTMYMQCEHKIPIVIEGRIARDARLAAEGKTMMARHGSAWAAHINGNAYRDYLMKHPKAQKVMLTRPQMEAIIRDLCEYSDRDAEATAWAEQATRSAARIAELEKAAEEAADAWLDGVQGYLEAPMRALIALIWPQEPRSDAPGTACDARTGKVVSVHDTAALRATDDERGMV